jgi:hypothetical protein
MFRWTQVSRSRSNSLYTVQERVCSSKPPRYNNPNPEGPVAMAALPNDTFCTKEKFPGGVLSLCPSVSDPLNSSLLLQVPFQSPPKYHQHLNSIQQKREENVHSGCLFCTGSRGPWFAFVHSVQHRSSQFPVQLSIQPTSPQFVRECGRRTPLSKSKFNIPGANPNTPFPSTHYHLETIQASLPLLLFPILTQHPHPLLQMRPRSLTLHPLPLLLLHHLHTQSLRPSLLP